MSPLFGFMSVMINY